MNRAGMLLRPVAVLLMGVLLMGSSCSDKDDPQPGGAQQSSTAQVLQLSRDSSETAEPFAINDGRFVFNDTRETGEPLAINLP